VRGRTSGLIEINRDRWNPHAALEVRAASRSFCGADAKRDLPRSCDLSRVRSFGTLCEACLG
jgi:hypothetical protein